MGPTYTWEVLVLNGADHGECGVVGRSGLRGDLVLGGLGRREHLIQHHHSVFDAFHIDERRKITNLCACLLLLFYLLAYLALAGLMIFLDQISNKIHHFTVYNLMPLAFLTKLSNMHLI